MGAQGARTAFRVWAAYEHKSKASVISAVAVDQSGNRIYLGLSDGQLEEHRISLSPSGLRVALGARKHVGKKAVTSICHLEAARKLAVLCDGALHLLEQETLEGHALAGIKGISCMALDGGGGYPPRLALAVRTGKKSSRLMVYEVVAGADVAPPLGLSAMCTAQGEIPEPLLIKGLAWLGRQIVVCSSLRYALWDPITKQYTELLSVPEEAPSPTLLLPIPSANSALLLMEQAGITIDKSGAPTGTALTLPAPNPALASAAMYVLAAGADGVHVYDRTTAEWVQSLPYPGGLRAAPGQQLAVAQNVKGSCILVAGYRKVWMYRPVALDEQARELLQARKYGQALHLADTCSGEGAPWAESAFAEAAFLLIHELRVREATAALLRCSLTLFQPLELFPLFPEHTGRWVSLLPSKQYWGLHPPLPDLRVLVRERVGEGTPGQTLLREARQAVADYLLKVRKREGVEARDGIDTLLVALLCEAGSRHQLRGFAGGRSAARVSDVAPLLRARGHLHVLALLYANDGQVAAALRLWKEIADSCAATVDQGRSAKEEEERRNPDSSPVTGKEGSSASIAGKEGRSWGSQNEKGEVVEPNPMPEAVECAARLMADEVRVSPELALEYLPWLLGSSQEAALTVLKARRLPDEEVLALLQETGFEDLHWQYLQHLVEGLGSTDPAHHTALALGLTNAALRLMPSPNPRQAAWERARAAGARSPGPVGGRLRELRQRLCHVLEQSPYYDAPVLLQRVASTDLWDEQFLLHSRVGDQHAALRVMALVVGDMRRATAFCEDAGGQEAYMTLLSMLLHPGEGRQPLYTEACQLLAAQGSQLDPRSVLDALSEDMPLEVAFDTLARMLRERTHRRRQGLITRHLHRSLNLTASATRAEMMSRRVVTEEQRACRLCHTRIGTKMFAVYPNDVLVCFKCYRGVDPHVCPVTGRDFRVPALPEP